MQPHERELRLSCFLLVPFLLLFGLADYSQSVPPPASAAARQAAISVKTELVSLPVKVTDADGSFVSGLNLADFSVYEDGRLQKISVFQSGDDPVTVGLIVDHSQSMRPKLSGVIAAIFAFAQSSNPQDEMFVVDFNDTVSLDLPGGKPFTSDPREVVTAIGSVRASGETALYDAVIAGLRHLQLGHWGKKALIIVSDGGDNASRQKYSQVLALTQRSPAMIYSIGLLGAENEEENPGVLKRLCKNTGGVAYFPSSTSDVVDASTQIARDLRQQYTLGFAPEKTGTGHSFRKLQVKVSAPGRGKLHVRTRLGYSAPDEKQSPSQPGKGAL